MPIIEEILEEFWTNNLEVLTILDEEKLLINITIKKCQDAQDKQVEELKKMFEDCIFMRKSFLLKEIDKIFKNKK